ncbi:glutamate racemase [Marinomonas sp. THO17]|uniref:glutamate racemase n=1 Tax=Marinomonas sp. THO17 TaxID=3149048 RepID=UPI00336C14CE
MKVGVMDSGAGGLTIVNAIQKKQPHLDLLYLADDAFAPYGDKTDQALQQRLIDIANFFEREAVQAIVVACNTATVAGIEALRSHTQLPVIGVEPAVKPAFRLGKQRHVAVLATPVTAKSRRLNDLISLWQADSKVQIVSSASLAFDIDAWPATQSKIQQTVMALCQQMKTDEVDTLVLACTHYPLVRHMFAEYLGADCEIIEPSEGVSAQLTRRLVATYPELVESESLSEQGQITLCSSLSLAGAQRLRTWVDEQSSIAGERLVSI